MKSWAYPTGHALPQKSLPAMINQITAAAKPQNINTSLFIAIPHLIRFSLNLFYYYIFVNILSKNFEKIQGALHITFRLFTTVWRPE
jgi:hypothetical protein